MAVQRILTLSDLSPAGDMAEVALEVRAGGWQAHGVDAGQRVQLQWLFQLHQGDVMVPRLGVEVLPGKYGRQRNVQG